MADCYIYQDQIMKNLTFSFDIGYSSIGWSAIECSSVDKTMPSVVGTGVVLFGADGCLASKRREYRRMRRTIRARRKRIERLAQIMSSYNVLTQEEVTQPGHPAPFFLAARALKGKQKLSALELWHVLRWYAHNRGYDANRNWSKEVEEVTEDTQRVTMARNAMQEYGTSTMAETIVSILQLNTNENTARFDIKSPKYKKLNLAFPREIVEREVHNLIAVTPDIPDIVKSLILEPACNHRDALAFCGIRFPKRYHGSILFGQLMPRFDNRIIARCPITWAQTYRKALNSGLSEEEAKKDANKYAKVPKADCAEFYEYRFARILANIRVNNLPLPADMRQQLMSIGKEKGRFTKTEFTKTIQLLTNNAPNNLKNYFHLVPRADEALIVVPSEQKYRATGRAPYARPVLRQVVAEILRGEDPSRPARSLEHMSGEEKSQDGILYATLNPKSDVYKLQQERSIESQTNNHLVRHRLLILGRLLKDMLKRYAQGDASLVKQCCVEVNRELREFSGLTAQEIKKQLSEKLKDFQSAVKYLHDKAPDLQITAGIIRKCRIAMDMKWTCPYTGMMYGPHDLHKMDKDHIVPYATRSTNAMSALVLTYPEVNRMKGKRTAVEFIKDCQGLAVDGKENIQIWTEKRFKDFVEKLDTKGARDDKKRKEKRKQLLLVESTPSKGDKSNLGFTEGQLTQSSQLVRMAAQIVKKKLKNASVISIPGQVTAEVRCAWKIMGALEKTVHDIVDEQNRIKEKSLIRDITHLHHAVDACTLGLIPILIPSGKNGAVWKLLAQRQLNGEELSTFKESGYQPVLALTEKNKIYLRDIPDVVKKSIEVALAEKRIVRHVSADMSGAKLNEQYSGIIDYHSQEPELKDYVSLRNRCAFYGLAMGEKVTLIPRKEAPAFINEYVDPSAPVLQFGQTIFISGLVGNESKFNGEWQIVSISEDKKRAVVNLERSDLDLEQKLWKKAPILELWKNNHIKMGKVLPVKTWVRKSKLMGLSSIKMRKNSAALTITENYGVVVSPVVEIIRHASVYKFINRLKALYPNEPIQILRPGMIISLTTHKDESKRGKWRVSSVKDNAKGPALDLQRLESSVSASATAKSNWINASLSSIMKGGLLIYKKSYIE